MSMTALHLIYLGRTAETGDTPMSFMSLFEKSVRSSAAISVLNKRRHALQGRSNSDLSSEELSVLREALENIESPHLDRMVVHNFQGLDTGLSSSVGPISVALSTAAEQRDMGIAELKELLLKESYSEIDPDKKRVVEEILDLAIRTADSEAWTEHHLEGFSNCKPKGI